MNKICLNEQYDIFEKLSQYISESKKEKIKSIVENRTKHLTVVLEDIKDSKDASAVIRSCECFGIFEVNIIENIYRYKLNRHVLMGAYKWVKINHYEKEKTDNNTERCINDLKEKGYRIAGITSNKNAQTIENLDITQKTAIIFGTEEKSLSDIALKKCDTMVRIPAYGYNDGYYLSSGAAITIHSLTERLRKSDIDWKMSENEIIDIQIQMVKKLLRKPSNTERKYFEKYKIF